MLFGTFFYLCVWASMGVESLWPPCPVRMERSAVLSQAA